MVDIVFKKDLNKYLNLSTIIETTRFNKEIREYK